MDFDLSVTLSLNKCPDAQIQMETTGVQSGWQYVGVILNPAQLANDKKYPWRE